MNSFSCKVKLSPRDGTSNKKLISDGSFYLVRKLAKDSRVKRLKETEGPHIFVESLSSPVTRWVALINDPDYIVTETGI